MTDASLAHIARLIQDLNKQFTSANHHFSHGWLAHEMMRDTIVHLTVACQEMKREAEHRVYQA